MDVTKNENSFDDAVEKFARLEQPADEEKETPSPSDDKDGDDTDNKAKDPKETDDAEDGDEQSTDDSDEETADESETEDGDDAADEDAKVVKVPVDGKEIEYTIGSLKRLAGQEASLTRKSQEVAASRKQLDDVARVHIAALDKMLERARSRYEPFSKIDFLVASKDPNISGEELSAVRDQATKAYEDVKFLEQEMGTFAQELAMREHATLQQQAQDAIKVLSDPEKGIQGWSEQLYMDMRKYAVDQGIDVARFDRTVDPATIKLLHKAYLYDKGKKKVQTTKVESKSPPKKIVKSTTSPEAAKRIVKQASSNQAMKKLQKTHKLDDAIAAFEERFAPPRDDD